LFLTSSPLAGEDRGEGENTIIINDDQKIAKKQAKAQVKTIKKQGAVENIKADRSNGSGDPSPAERAATAAERQVKLQRWRVAFACPGQHTHRHRHAGDHVFQAVM